MEIVRTLDKKKWQEFVDNQPISNIFHTPEMFQVFSLAKGHRPTLWAVINSNQQILALLPPVQVMLAGGFIPQLTTRSILYGSVLCAPNSQGKLALDLLFKTYRQEIKGKVLFTELRNLADLSDLHAILQKNNFVYEKHLNYLIDINRPVEAVLQSIGSRTRKKIRKGVRDNLVEVTEVINRCDLDDWYETLNKSFKHAKIPLADRSLFEAAFNVLHPKGLAKFLLAKVRGEPAACSVELIHKDTIYGWYGGVDRNYSNYSPNEMLMWYILEWGANNGYKVYDFGGAGSPDEDYGVRDFKAKFNGDLVCFGRYTYVHSAPLLRLSELGYKVYRQLL